MTPGTHVIFIRSAYYHHVWVIIVISLKINLLLINNTKYKSFWMVYCVVSCNILLKGFTRFCRCFGKFVSVEDPGLQIRGMPSNPDHDIRRGGRSPKKISRPFGPQFGLKIREGPVPPGPSPGSATLYNKWYWSIYVCTLGTVKGGGGGGY